MSEEAKNSAVLVATRKIGLANNGKHQIEMRGVCRAGKVDDTGDLVGAVVGPVVVEVHRPSLRVPEEIPQFKDQQSIGAYFRNHVDDERTRDEAREKLESACEKIGEEVAKKHPEHKDLFPTVERMNMEFSAHDPEAKFLIGKGAAVCTADKETDQKIRFDDRLILGFTVPLQKLPGAMDRVMEAVPGIPKGATNEQEEAFKKKIEGLQGALASVDASKLDGKPVNVDDFVTYAAGYMHRSCKANTDAIAEKQGRKRPAQGI